MAATFSQFSYTGSNPYVKALATTQAWTPGSTVTFYLKPSDWDGNGINDWDQAGAGDALRRAYDTWAAVANIRFQEVNKSEDANFVEEIVKPNSFSSVAYHSSPFASQGVGGYDLMPYQNQARWNQAGGSNNREFIHETGHGIGLSHPFDNHNGARFPGVVDAQDPGDNALNYELYSVMSYRSDQLLIQGGPENGYGYISTPLAFDIAAAQAIYGANNQTNNGDNVYALTRAANGVGGTWVCIWDTGGTDTIQNDSTVACVIDLRPASLLDEPGGGGWISRVYGGTYYFYDESGRLLSSTDRHLSGGYTIANGVVIENAIGGPANDLLVGNDAANHIRGEAGDDTLMGGAGADTLEGGAGNDTFAGTLAELSGDLITDFASGDRIVISGTLAAGLSYSFANNVLSVGGQTIRLAGYGGPLVLRTGEAGQAVFAVGATTNDFTGDGRSDILFRNTSGALSTWSVGGNGTAVQQGSYNASVSTDWRIVETADFNGDGRADILWRHAGGTVSIWNATIGGFQPGSYTNGSVGNDWRIAATGDINGDGKDDLLWQHSSGAISAWSSTGNGFAANSYSHASPGAGWLVAGLADLNGDGRADIVWRNTGGGVATWMATSTGYSDGGYFTTVPTSWHIDGLGDFNGDGRSDMLWRNDNGGVSLWLSNGTGFDQGTYNTNVPTSWSIAQVGDFNGDGRADILWRNDNGAVSTWQSNGRGFDQAVYNSSAPTSWGVAAHDFVL